jgi:uncharacterized membrane protein
MMNSKFTILQLAILLLPVLTLQVYAQEPYTIMEVSVTIYRDGEAHVRLTASVDVTEPSITLQLLSSQVYNVLALDEENTPLSYDINGLNITVYTFGASKLVIEYDTETLTSKSAGIWTISLTTPYQLNLTLPEGAIILYFNAPPASIRSEGEKLILTILPGTWEINYTFEATTSPRPQPPQRFPIELALAISCSAALAAVALLLFRRKRMFETLRREEIEVIRFLKERGGRALEAELREAFPDIPRTSMWRLIKRLERKGIVTVKKVGMQNVVQLKSTL